MCKINMLSEKTIVLICFTLCLVCYGLYIETSIKYSTLIYEYNLLQNKSKCEMYNAYNIVQEKSIANGLYWYGKDFYCVWADSRTLEEQEATDRHEYCHYLVDNDYEHFCKFN